MSSPLPQDNLVDNVLTSFSLNYLRQGLVRPLLELFRNVEFTWTGWKEEMKVSNYSTYLNVWMEACGWEMRVEEEPEGNKDGKDGKDGAEEKSMILISQPKGEESITEREIE